MKYALTVIFALVTLTHSMASCNKVNNTIIHNNNQHNDTIGNTIKITIGTAVFTATLNNNATVAAFKAMLPLTINMQELNGNEKFYYFPSALPTNASVGGNLQIGDIMLYGNNCLVLFYEALNTSYSYTKLGHITNANGLVNALGKESVTIKLELQ